MHEIHGAPMSNHHTKGNDHKDFTAVPNELINGRVFNISAGRQSGLGKRGGNFLVDFHKASVVYC